MNHEKVQENRKEDKRALVKFAVLIVCSLLCGMVVGILIIKMGSYVAKITTIINFLLNSVMKYACFAVTLAAMAAVFYLYIKSRKIFLTWNGENEEELNRMELNLSYAIWFTTVDMILAFFFFAAGYNMLFSENPSEQSYFINLFWTLGGFIFAIVFVVVAQQKLVNFIKEINPEKRGSVYDLKFSKKWKESCDEAEQMAIYKSAYRSYKAVNKTCITLWLVCALGRQIWDFGLMPVAMVSIIWLVQVSAYCLEAIRLSKYVPKES
jgi:hypothetical protein